MMLIDVVKGSDVHVEPKGVDMLMQIDVSIKGIEFIKQEK